MRKDITRICICSGKEELDLSRAKTALEYRRELKENVPIRILGAGPDLPIALREYEYFKIKERSEEELIERLARLDHHLRLYNFLLERIGEKPEAAIESVTLVQNVLKGFLDYENGNFAIVTEPWHYKKFDRIQKVLKERGKISPGLEFFSVPSPDTGYYTPLQKFLSNIKSNLELRGIN